MYMMKEVYLCVYYVVDMFIECGVLNFRVGLFV